MSSGEIDLDPAGEMVATKLDTGRNDSGGDVLCGGGDGSGSGVPFCHFLRIRANAGLRKQKVNFVTKTNPCNRSCLERSWIL